MKGKILLAYGISSETVASIMMLYKNTKALVRSPDIHFFDIKAGVLQGDTLPLFIFIYWISNRHPAKTLFYTT